MQTLVPDTFARHWEETLQFLTIVTEHWPAHLDEHGLVSKMRHDKHQVLAQAKRLRAAPPAAPVIVAGVMSSVPAVTELLSVVAGLPNGALVLPGLDQSLDDESWNAIVPAHPEHPQFGLKKLLDALGVRREDVLPLPGPAPDAPQRARASLVSEAMRPARTTERWHRFMAGIRSKEMAQALAGVAILEAPGAEDEAEAVALILREVVETPGRTAALVTPDRELARRVAARLATWDLHVEDFGRAAAGPDPGRRLPRSRHRGGGDAAAAGGADGAAQASAVPARHGRGRAAPRLAHARAGRLPHCLFRRRAGRRRSRAGEGAGGHARQEAPPAGRPPPRSRRLEGRAQPAAPPRQGAGAAGAAVRVLAQDQPGDAGGGPHRRRRGLGQARRGGGRRAAVGRRRRRGGLQVPGLAQRRGGHRAGHAGGRLSGVLSQPGRGGDGAAAGADASAHLHLGALRVAPAAPRRGDPGLAQRGHLAAGRRSRPLAQPADAAGAGPAGAGGAHRRRRAHLHLAARRRARVSHARRQDRRRADGALALAAAAAGTAGRRRRRPWGCGAVRPAVARLGTRAQRAGRPGEAGARTRAQARAGAPAAPAQRHRDRALDRQSVRRVRRAHPGARGAAGAGPAARRRAARPDRARRARPLRAAVPGPAAT